MWLSSVARSCTTRDESNKDNVCTPTISAGINRPLLSRPSRIYPECRVYEIIVILIVIVIAIAIAIAIAIIVKSDQLLSTGDGYRLYLGDAGSLWTISILLS